MKHEVDCIPWDISFGRVSLTLRGIVVSLQFLCSWRFIDLKQWIMKQRLFVMCGARYFKMYKLWINKSCKLQVSKVWGDEQVINKNTLLPIVQQNFVSISCLVTWPSELHIATRFHSTSTSTHHLENFPHRNGRRCGGGENLCRILIDHLIYFRELEV